MSSPRSRAQKTTCFLLAVYLGIFLTLLPGLHDHGPCQSCREVEPEPARNREHPAGHAADHGCRSCPDDDGPTPAGPAIDGDRSTFRGADSCVVCKFLRSARLFTVVASVSLERLCLQETLSSVRETPDRLPSSYRRLPRGPPSA